MKFSLFQLAASMFAAYAYIGCSDAGFRDNPNDPGAVGFEDGEVTGDMGNYSVYDSRDKRSYKVVKIGNYFWLAENLNHPSSDSFCYDGESSNCKTNGRLYRWTTANPCMEGWRRPNKTDWINLFNTANGIARAFLADNRLWGMDVDFRDNHGFSILPSGIRNSDGTYLGQSSLAGFWTITRDSDNDEKAYAVWVTGQDLYPDISPYSKKAALSIRCIKEK